MKLPPRHRVLMIAVGLAVAAALALRFLPVGGSGGATAGTAGAVGQSVVVSGPAPAESPTTTGATTGATSSPATTAPGGDGADNTGPVLVQPATQPGVQDTATGFAAAWLNTYKRSPEDWRADLLNRVTPDLAEDLADADPATVPAGAKTLKVTVTRQEDLYGASAPIVTADGRNTPIGTLKLTVVQRNGVWLVSAIDWEPKR